MSLGSNAGIYPWYFCVTHSHGFEGSQEVFQFTSHEFATNLPSGNVNFFDPPLNFLQDKVFGSPMLNLNLKYPVNHRKALIRLFSPPPPGSSGSSPPHSLLITRDVGPKTAPKKAELRK